MLLATIFGMPGIVGGLMLILFHVADLRSFGVPYLSPIGPLNPGEFKDVFIRLPHWAMINRPRFPGSKNPRRQNPGNGPQKPK
jgi:Bacillus/Clostridium GerA spore germination protein.